MGSRRRREREQQEMWLEFQTYQQQRCNNCPIYSMFNDMLRQQQMQGQPGPVMGQPLGQPQGQAAGGDGQAGMNLGNLGGMLNSPDIWKSLNLPPELDMLRRLFMSRTVQIPKQPPMPGPFAPMAGPPMASAPMTGAPMTGPMPQQREGDEGDDRH